MRTLPISLLIFAFALSAAAQTPAQTPATDQSTPAQSTPPAAAPPRVARPPAPPIVPTVVPPALAGPVTYTCGAAKKGATALTQSTLFTPTSAGWDLKTVPAVANGVCSAASDPFFFSIPVPPGNYRVTLALGGKEASTITVRAEARRLYVQTLPIAAGKTVTRALDVNVRIPEFTKPDGTQGRVRLKGREEAGNLDWDAKLTLEFNGVNPAFHSLTIEPLTGAKAEPTLYLAGDSTMVDQDVEPWTSWGQQLTRFLLPGVVVANHAESGESAASFVGEQRWAEVLSLIKPGDWFFVQFAHNDQKVANGMPRYIEIMTDFVNQVRAKGATPVIVTAMNRETFDASGAITDSLGGYPQASRQIAKDTNTALIDLNAMSKTMYEAMGPAGADHLFMKFKAGSYPGVERDISDTTHFNGYGAYEIARSIVHGIRGIPEAKLPIARFLDPSVPDFDPAHPDAFADFHLPYTPPQKQEDVTQIPQANLK
jgi:lysophospholipase L1-like esterase